MPSRGKSSHPVQRGQTPIVAVAKVRRRPSARILAALVSLGVGAVFAVYSRSLSFQFILDDHRFTSDPRIQESGHIWEYFTNYVWAQFVGGPVSFYRPIFVLWVRANFALIGPSSWGWHLLSIGKHVMVSTLLGLLSWKLLRDWKPAFVAAILFALHPAQTESVSWVTVPDPLMTITLLSSLLLYLRYVLDELPGTDAREKRSSKKSVSLAAKPSRLWLIGSAAAYFAALLTKETAIVFLGLIFVVAACLTPAKGVKNSAATDRPPFAAQLRRAVRLSVPFVCVTAAYLLLRLNALGGKLTAATQHLPRRTVLLSWPAVLWFYFKAMLWPVKSYSFADPPQVEQLSMRGFLLPLLAVTGTAAITAAVLFWIWRTAQQNLDRQQVTGVKVALGIGTLLLVFPLLPPLDLNALNPGDFLHGRYSYLPLAGLMLLLATACRVLENFKVVWLCLAGIVAIAFVPLTLAQEAQWRDDAAVFATGHRLAPHNQPVAKNLANTSVEAALRLQDQGRCTEAIPMLDQVIKEYPDDSYAWAGRGVCYVQLNDLAKAEQSFHRAADISRNPQVVQKWQELRAHMGLPNSAPSN